MEEMRSCRLLDDDTPKETKPTVYQKDILFGVIRCRVLVVTFRSTVCAIREEYEIVGIETIL